jgi:hypothetical protein
LRFGASPTTRGTTRGTRDGKDRLSSTSAGTKLSQSARHSVAGLLTGRVYKLVMSIVIVVRLP